MIFKKQSILLALAFLFAVLLIHFSDQLSKNWIKTLIFTLQGKTTNPIIIDDNGIPFIDYQQDIGLQRNPVTIADVSIKFYDEYHKNGDLVAKQKFLNDANWLVQNAVAHNNYSIFEYKFPSRSYNLTPPWHSGMAQGLALRNLMKAYELTGNDVYLQSGNRIVNAFYVEVRDGGVTYKNQDGWWYEEYAGINGKEPHVLNGMMYALIDVYNYYVYTNNTNAKYIFDRGIQALKSNIQKYDDPDNSGYTYYDLLGNPAWDYQIVHVNLANKLYEITGDEVFKQYSKKWQKFRDISSFGAWLKHPTNVRFVSLVGNIIALHIILNILTIRIVSKKVGLVLNLAITRLRPFRSK